MREQAPRRPVLVPRQGAPDPPFDPSRRRLLVTGSAALAALAGLLPARASASAARVSWSTRRACPGEEVEARAELPGVVDGTPVRFAVRAPDGSVTTHRALALRGAARLSIRLVLPPAHARPGLHRFEVTARAGL